MIIRELMFFNYDATPQEVRMHVAPDAIPNIMAWYGAYFAGDRYNVFVDGRRVEKDQNGERVTPEIDGVAK